MSMAIRVWVSVILLLLGVYAAYGGYRAYVKVSQQTETTPTFERRVAPEGTLVDTAGEPFDMKSLKGKPWVGSFFFASCPGPCAEMNRAIAKLQQDLPDNEVPFISITVDPTNDTPERLARYSEGFGADPKRWKFLTGPFDYIKHLGQDMFKVAVGPQTHAKTVMLVDGDGQVLGSYDATMPAEMLTLKRQLEKLDADPGGAPDGQPASSGKDSKAPQADEAQT